MNMQDLLRRLSRITAPLFDKPISPGGKIDLKGISTDAMPAYIAQMKEEKGHVILWGGYLEKREVYATYPAYEGDEPRCIHLGIDFWAPAGKTVHAPLPGIVHSFADNDLPGDYGPTIILRHTYAGQIFHSLYGHLSRRSLEGLYVGKRFDAGARIGWLGNEEENGGWPPHLHFQLIVDMGKMQGDYPGVCKPGDLEFYSGHCPDPGDLLRL